MCKQKKNLLRHVYLSWSKYESETGFYLDVKSLVLSDLTLMFATCNLGNKIKSLRRRTGTFFKFSLNEYFVGIISFLEKDCVPEIVMHFTVIRNK